MNRKPTPETNELVKTQLARVGMTPSVLAAKLTIKCESLERERDEARSNAKPMGAVTIARNGYIEELEEQRYQAIRERDMARQELATVTEQRDRLAEAVNAATILIAAKGRHNA